jgi:hypothetical protein
MEVYRGYKSKNIFLARRKMNSDAFWKKASVLTSFIFPWNSDAPPNLLFRALHDSRHLYFRFDVIDSSIIVSKESRDKMVVLNSDRVEIFFRSDEDMKFYYGLEMDPEGRVLDYKAEYYRKFDYSWKWKGITVRSDYTVNGYRVWGCIPLKSLEKMNLLKNNSLQVGLFRGKCIQDPGGEISFKWISWAKPESETPDFHIPSAFGRLDLG